MLKNFQMSAKAGPSSVIWSHPPYGADLVVVIEWCGMNHGLPVGSRRVGELFKASSFIRLEVLMANTS